jgi:opacity protein-like surface antigen
MKKLFPVWALAAILLPALPASAEPIGVYVAPRLSGGLASFHFKGPAYDWDYGSHSEWAYGGALAVGYDFHPSLRIPLRVELEYHKLGDVEHSETYHDLGGSWKGKSTLGISTLFVNGYFDWHNPSQFTPYVSLGLGRSSLSAKMKESDSWWGTEVYGRKTTTNFSWNIGFGSALQLSDTISLDLGYRYANLGKAKSKLLDTTDPLDYVKTKNVETHQLLFGAKFSF